MTQVPYLSNEELLRRVMRGGRPDVVLPEPPARGALGRVLPGTVLVAAALVLPGFSVGAGDLEGAKAGRSRPNLPRSPVRGWPRRG